MRRTGRWFGWVLLVGCALARVGPAEELRVSSRLENPAKMRSFYGVEDAWLTRGRLSEVRVAVLSSGFNGIETGPEPENEFLRRIYLPLSTELIASYDVATFGLDGRSDIGRRVAQILWAMTGLDSNGPLFRLYNANGLVAFREAVRGLAEWGADVVVCTENFPGFGNFDGTGILNAVLDPAAKERIWIQSADTFATRVLNLSIAEKNGRLDDMKPIVTVNAADTAVTLTLSWNAYSKTLEGFRGTDKDLDLHLYDKDEREVASSTSRQVIGDPGEGETNFAIEQLETRLFPDRSPYRVEIRIKGGVFDPFRDELRLSLETDKKPYFDGMREVNPVELAEGSRKESIPVPADNRFVTTVGSSHPFSSEGPTADGRAKPDLVLDGAEALFTDKVAISGPDVAAAQIGAVATLYKAAFPEMTREQWERSLAESQRDPAFAPRPDQEVSRRFDMLTPEKMETLLAR